MDRKAYRIQPAIYYTPYTRGIPPVDLYLQGRQHMDPSWNNLDTTYPFYTYDAFGYIQFQLPLENWPENRVTNKRYWY
jgi:hypothetical protein